MSKKAIGVHGSSALSYTDHITPLCQILDIPLLVTDPWIFELTELYYPKMHLIYESPSNYDLSPHLKDYDAFVTVSHFKKFQGGYLMGDYLVRSEAKSIYSLHGNSDKKRDLFWVEQCLEEDIVLLYGEFFRDFIKEKGVYHRLSHPILCGNYRLEFYKNHKEFFQKKISPHLFKDSNRMSILYAPTWSSPNKKSEWRVDYSSYLSIHSQILNTIPSNFQIYVKTHPFMEQLYPKEMTEIRQCYEKNPQVKFIEDCPLIYPLLEHIDVYLGDYSSIGYDFLYFDRPLLFLNDGHRDLDLCGTKVTPDKIYHALEKEDTKSEIRKKTYSYSFTHIPLSQLKREVEAFL
ncbi:MAG: CDP-glycerol glycerophosphotransferase family protein [Chlamydiia bacterium]|nr:CDP-glycerol glycerophosphotransferase family protein [Chlamydiia bacterium]